MPGGSPQADHPRKPRQFGIQGESAAMTRLYSYIVTHDTGFAPNPFHGFCTLATCKPMIRKTAKVGDWVIGTGSKSKDRNGYIVYAMRITEKMSFDEYWNDPRFRAKKPGQEGCWKSACGDNIYWWDHITNGWAQAEDSYHCDYDVGRDTKYTEQVLVSENFVYWGGDGPPLPPEFGGVSVLCTTQGYKCRFPEGTVSEFARWVGQFEERGICGYPLDKDLQIASKTRESLMSPSKARSL